MSTEAPKTAKRDALRELEGKARALWEKEKTFEVNAPTIEEHPNTDDLHKVHPKFMSCMAFPYMNGRLHLGHAFTFSKVEFGIGYERMKGKRALLPQGFHCTGMPIKACADKLAREIEMFGKNFEKYDESKEEATEANKNVKSKVAAKTGNVTYQFQIMLSLGIPITEIHKFADPYYWTEFFPPQTIADMTAFGAKVDWRRSFITTDANPYFDAFVRWQMRKLKAMQKVKFGERYTIYSIVDKQPCMDHDRASGEALGPQEYTAIKMEVLEWSDAAKEALISSDEKLKGKKIYLVAATLRPETMYGQTNCFVGTEIKYGVYYANDNEAYVCTERAARNMAYQKIFAQEGVINKIAEIDGKDIVGTKIHAPLSKYPAVYVLPMENVLSTKGTGVVTSVPSDSPDDYATLSDLKKKPDYYKVKPEWVAFDPIPIIETPSYGNLTAPKLCEIKKINSQKDRVQLAEAKELAYKEAFYQGTMCIGEYTGMKVQEAKNKIRDILINSKEAFIYNEPEGLVMSRSGDECVVALLDQWYLDYGEEQWKAKTKKCLDQMNTYSNETRNQFEQVLDWLNKWACARSFGLGTKLPWDEQFLVESLSDSTIYMAYYTIAHLLHNDLRGSSVGPAGIKCEQMTDSVWDYIFGLGDYPADCGIPQATLDKLRREYEYFYPLDLRVSGKDLIPNHLTFFLYNHTAIFPEDKWPRGIRSNGHLMLDSKKMSKSTGNFMTMSDAVSKYGADATRFALADAGDSIEDANFEDATANAAILRLYTLLEWSEEQVAKADSLRTGEFNFFDKIFENEMNKLIILTNDAYEATYYRDVLKYGVYEFQAAKDAYQIACTETGMHKDLIMRYIETQALLLSPITPHWSEHIWRTLLKKESLIVNALFPKPSAEVNEVLEAATRYIRKTIKAIRDAELNLVKKKKKGKAAEAEYKPSEPKSLKIYVATKFPEWQEATLNVMKEHYSEGQFDDIKIRQQLGAQGMLKDKKVMPFVQEQKKLILKEGPSAFNRALIFNEIETLETAMDEIKRALGFHTVTILGHDQWAEEDLKAAESAVPGVPSFSFKNEIK
ncbi:leucyl-tRNA synthetase [Rhizopus microsporus var. microsporus]|uniref:leucine--tRNA ligase n=2 Tax=Rhizopus microsporus TaxID=58291 RepID=A0A2G4SKC1_RHIZD|nr:leucyl-tRNA synthetase [Rhizopus microsporus ATCC 52813]ORE03939.1 leucyl-tRNA synthetase [Rhizopus microsporus var. microsporus]PHZ08826.1 leucyl-tRNA synthetase [Rhizopus microsporus ATCC 52813]